jgi:hypothetical protein
LFEVGVDVVNVFFEGQLGIKSDSKVFIRGGYADGLLGEVEKRKRRGFVF